MVFLKEKEEIELIKEGAIILSKTLGVIAQQIKPGIATKELDKQAEGYIKSHGGSPSFKGYKGYPCALCISVNEDVVHGLPSSYRLCEGDIVSVDCGVYYKGFHSDSAFTYPVGAVSDEVLNLLKVTKEALYLGIEEVSTGKRVGDIGHKIQTYAEAHGYSVVRELVGHGIGRNLHEAPEVPNYGRKGSGTKLRNGMVMAIEPMINLGDKRVVYKSDGTVSSLDRKPSAHFEHTVALWENEAQVLTTYQYIEDALEV